MKPSDDYVRGYKDAKYMIDKALKDAIDVMQELVEVTELWEDNTKKKPQPKELNND